MISEIQIENFKSIAKLSLKPGRVTVLIGENGSGKSNILEAIAFASAAAADKLDDEFLYNRGIRVTEADWMTSAFVPPVTSKLRGKEIAAPIKLNVIGNELSRPLGMRITRGDRDSENEWRVNYTVGEDEIKAALHADDFEETLEKFRTRFADLAHKKSDAILRQLLATTKAVRRKRMEAPEVATKLRLKDFLIFAPENSVLRNFDVEGAIKPLGTKGEGLLRLLQKSVERGDGKFTGALKQHLSLLGWFSDVKLPTEEDEIKGRLQISDRWLPGTAKLFDQRSANEGFLYLLFYFTLLLSKATPSFFAIDNIDNSLNPKLCAELTRLLVALAEKQGKQAILTTHNPAILDGLNLHDDQQRLYVVRRNSEGHTVVSRVKPPRPRPEGPPVKLSTAFMSGLLGGLPDHF